VSDLPTKRDRTIYGMPAFVPDELPFPLHPYVACGDSHTPSREYNRAEPTAPQPFIPRRRDLTPEERVIVRELDRCRKMPRPGMEPSTLAKATAAVIVCAVLWALLFASLAH
jgi:hypothetical protein